MKNFYIKNNELYITKNFHELLKKHIKYTKVDNICYFKYKHINFSTLFDVLYNIDDELKIYIYDFYYYDNDDDDKYELITLFKKLERNLKLNLIC
jgi:hypothetical protein